jgi:hypothetical protein
MEFDATNILSILSFDSGALKYLLHSNFKKYFNSMYPLFYKNKYHRLGSSGQFFRNAIDGAIRLNQAESIDKIIEFIVVYQNNFSSSFIFNKNFPILLKKGISMAKLLNSNVFQFSFDFDEWPGTHTV